MRHTTDQVRHTTDPVRRTTDQVRFLPDARNGTTAEFSYVAWDRSQGLAGSTLAFSDGPDSPFSTAVDSATITVTSRNDAPILAPINPTFASLNLAQAVLLVSYEWHRATQGLAAPFELAHRTGPAKRETLFSFFSFVEQELDRVRFLFPTHRRAVMIRNFRNILHRMSLTEQDVRTMRGALDRLVSGPRPDRAKAKDPPLHISDRTDGTG